MKLLATLLSLAAASLIASSMHAAETPKGYEVSAAKVAKIPEVTPRDLDLNGEAHKGQVVRLKFQCRGPIQKWKKGNFDYIPLHGPIGENYPTWAAVTDASRKWVDGVTTDRNSPPQFVYCLVPRNWQNRTVANMLTLLGTELKTDAKGGLITWPTPP